MEAERNIYAGLSPEDLMRLLVEETRRRKEAEAQLGAVC